MPLIPTNSINTRYTLQTHKFIHYKILK